MNTVKKDESDLEGIVHAEGMGGRVIVFRIKPGFDIIDGIKRTCKYYKLEAGVITSIFGSLEKVKLMVPLKGLAFPVAEEHEPRIIYKEIVNLASGCGFVNTLEDGEITIHIHMLVFDGGLGGPSPEFPVVGGHLDIDMPTPCLGTVEIAIEEVKGLKLIRKLDKDVGLPVTCPVQE